MKIEKNRSWLVSLFFTLLLSVVCLQANAIRIPLEGTWEDVGHRSLLPAVSADVEGSTLCVNFRYATSNATVYVFDGASVVFQETISVTSAQSVCFDLSELGAGDYHLEIRNLSANNLQGDFVIE